MSLDTPSMTPVAITGPPIRRAGRVLARHGIVVATAVLFVVLSVASASFLTTTNLLNILEINADVGIVACAATFVVVAGGIDLSVGAIVAFAGVVSAEIAISAGTVPGIVAGVLSGAALGACNGALISVGRVDPFIATLAAGLVMRSVALVITGGGRVVPSPHSAFADLGTGDVLGIRNSVWLFAIVALVTGVVLARQRFGRATMMVGTNPIAARLSGLSVGRVRALTFMISGLAAGVAGVLVASRSGQASSDDSLGFELPVIAAVAIGGANFRGGEGSVPRTVLGVLFVGLVDNGLNLLGVDPRYQRLVLGALVLAAVTLDVLARRSSESAS